MTSTQQRAELQRQIWQIANDVRGSVDGWDFKQYVLGTLFYRFISENFANYIEGGDESINYAELPDNVITAEIKDDAIKTKGYFIYPSQLFANIAAGSNTNDSLNTDLAANAGKSGGEFFTPQHVSKLIARLAMHKQSSVNKIYDPAGVLAPKHKADTKTQFIDASGMFKKATNNNLLTDEHIDKIMQVFDNQEDVAHFAECIEHDVIAENDYNLSVSAYVEAEDTREKIDITQLNAELKTTVAKIDQLRSNIDAIVAEIEGAEIEGDKA